MADNIPQEFDLIGMSEAMRLKIDIKSRKYHLKTYDNTFLGTDAVTWLMTYNDKEVVTLDDAIILGNQMIEDGLIYHAGNREKPFANEEYFYRFAVDDNHGKPKVSSDGMKLSWAAATKHLPILGGEDNAKNTDYEASARISGNDAFLQLPMDLDVFPMDEHNVALLDRVHPPKWDNPKHKSEYTLIVIGAGAGGLVTAAGAAGVGCKVAIIEEHLMGGDCLNVGCVPSKALIRASRAMKEVQNAGTFGVELSEPPTINFGKTMERLRKLRADIAKNDSCERFSQDLKVDVYQGRATFVDANHIKVDEKVLKFQKAVIATGARASVPAIDGLQNAPYLTNASMFNLTELPPRVAIIGAGT